MNITDSIEIKATPERVFEWIQSLKGKEEYIRWHPDHVDMRWIKGEPFKEGSIVYAEEYIHGRLHKIKFICTRVIPNRLIEYQLISPLPFFAPKNSFAMEPKGKDSCIFTTTASFRAGPLFGKLARKQIEAVKQHMKEEGGNLKKILEEEGRDRTTIEENRAKQE